MSVFRLVQFLLLIIIYGYGFSNIAWSQIKLHADTVERLRINDDYQDSVTGYPDEILMDFNKVKNNKKLILLALNYLDEYKKYHELPDAYNSEYNFLKGELEISYGRNWNAVEFFYKGYGYSKTKDNLIKFQNLVSEIMKENLLSAKRANYWENRRIIRKFNTLLSDSINVTKYNCYKALTNYHLSIFNEAYFDFIPLTLHDDVCEDFMSHREIEMTLMNLLFYTNRYKKALVAFKTESLSEDNNEISNNIKMYLSVQKAFYYRYVLNVLKRFYSKGNSILRLKEILNDDDYLSSLKSNKLKNIIIYEPNTGKKQNIIGCLNSKILDKALLINSFPVLMHNLSEDTNEVFLLDRIYDDIESPLIIIAFDNVEEQYTEEYFLYIELLNKYDNQEFWDLMNVFEQNNILKNISLYLSAIFQADHNILKNLPDYYSSLKNFKDSELSYLALIDDQKDIVVNLNYHPERYIIDDTNAFKKSLNTPVYLVQQFINRTDNTKLIDISNRLIINNQFFVLKIGFIKVY